MKQIAFNNKFGLTDLVMQGRKIMMRVLVPRIIVGKIRKIKDNYYQETFSVLTDKEALEKYYFSEHPKSKPYKVGEVIAITNKREIVDYIQITEVKIERVQDISDGDVIREGFSTEYVNNGWGNSASHLVYKLTYMEPKLWRYKEIASSNPQEAYSILFDKVHKTGTWDLNPWVFVYEFKRVDYEGNNNQNTNSLSER